MRLHFRNAVLDVPNGRLVRVRLPFRYWFSWRWPFWVGRYHEYIVTSMPEDTGEMPHVSAVATNDTLTIYRSTDT